MRRPYVALLLALLVAPAAAQPVRVLTDPAGDVDARLLDGSAAPDGTYDPEGADLLWLDVDETGDAVRFHLGVTSVAPGEDGSGQAMLVAEFLHADQPYRVVVERYPDFSGGFLHGGEVQAYDGGRERFVPVHRMPVEVDAAGNVFTVEVPREVLVDGNGTAPTAGREFRLLRAFSTEDVDSVPLIYGLGAVRMQDWMPDSGVSDQPYAVRKGLVQSGHARLHSDDPVRASNGEEATFVYSVTASNADEDHDRFDLAATGVPDGWDVTLPAATIRVPGNDSVTFPVLVSTQFSHQHGDFTSFVLTLTSLRDDRAVGRLEMGIRFLETPQPAGHHDTVWFHTRTVRAPGPADLCFGCGPTAVAFMNAAEEHALDEDVPAHANEAGTLLGGGQGWSWDVFLEPGLQLGLDFDVNRTGTLSVDLQAPRAVQGSSLGGRLVHYALVDAGSGQQVQRTVLATLVESTPRDLSGAVTLETVVVPTPEADLVPYNPRSALVLELELSGNNVAAYGTDEHLQPALTGGRTTLPLLEYRDPVDHVFSELAGLDFRHADRAEKYVNPGETVLFNMTLSNEGAIDDVFELRVNGTNRDWVRVLGDRRVFVGTGDHRNVVVAVSPPKDAPDGAVVDLVVTAASVAEPTVQGNIRVVATVDAVIDRPDEGYLIQDVEKSLTEKKSPGVAAPVILLAVALVALSRRRS